MHCALTCMFSAWHLGCRRDGPILSSAFRSPLPLTAFRVLAQQQAPSVAFVSANAYSFQSCFRNKAARPGVTLAKSSSVTTHIIHYMHDHMAAPALPRVDGLQRRFPCAVSMQEASNESRTPNVPPPDPCRYLDAVIDSNG